MYTTAVVESVSTIQPDGLFQRLPVYFKTDDDVLSNNVPSPWVKITSSRASEAMEPTYFQEHSCSWNQRAHARGSFAVAPGIRQLKPTTITTLASSSTISSQRVKTLPEGPVDWQQKPPPGFAEITKSLWGDNLLNMTIEVPPELSATQSLLAGIVVAMMVSMRLHQVLDQTYIDMMTTSMSLVGLGLLPWRVTALCPPWRVEKTQSLTNPPPLLQLPVFIGNYLP